MITTRQGPLLQGEWRQRLINGAYAIRASGIFQLDKDVFLRDDGVPTPGYRDWRGSDRNRRPVRAHRTMGLGLGRHAARPTRPISRTTASQTLPAQRAIRSQITARLKACRSSISPAAATAATSTCARSTSTASPKPTIRSQIPIIHPVIDYDYVFNNPIFGGELGFRINLTSLSRDTADLRSDHRRPPSTGNLCAPTTRRSGGQERQQLPAARRARHLHARLGRGELEDARSSTRSGQVFTPFVTLRADVAADERSTTQPGVSNYIDAGDTAAFRVMPTVGVEYRYPFINVQSWGTQTIEPIAQLIVRPNETDIGKLPERRCAEPDLRRQQPVQGRQVLRLGSRRRRRPRQRRRPIHRPVQPRRLRQCPVRTVLSAVRH